jgi:hypothetical protein
MMKNSQIRLAFSPIEYNINKIYNENLNKSKTYVSKYFFGGITDSFPFMGEEIYFYNKYRPQILNHCQFSLDSLLMFPFGKDDILLILDSFYRDVFDYIKERFPNAQFDILKGLEWDDSLQQLAVLQPYYYDRNVEIVKIKIPASDLRNMAGLRFYDNEGIKEKEYFKKYLNYEKIYIIGIEFDKNKKSVINFEYEMLRG